MTTNEIAAALVTMISTRTADGKQTRHEDIMRLVVSLGVERPDFYKAQVRLQAFGVLWLNYDNGCYMLADVQDAAQPATAKPIATGMTAFFLDNNPRSAYASAYREYRKFYRDGESPKAAQHLKTKLQVIQLGVSRAVLEAANQSYLNRV